jgi:hypothetical protein
MIRRSRRWELISELRPTSDLEFKLNILVGVPLVQIEHVNKTLNMSPDIRGWGMPSSVLQMIKVTPSTAPQEWKEQQQVRIDRKLAGGKHHKIWQLVSYFIITAKGMTGKSVDIEYNHDPPIFTPTISICKSLSVLLTDVPFEGSLRMGICAGEEFTMAEFAQREFITYCDSAD